MNGLPIIFIHRDACYYLPHSIAQAKAASPDSPVIILGNRGNSGLQGVRHVAYDRHADSAREFQKIYQHRSAHRVHDELFCFQRWLILRDFLKAEKIPACLYLDSDVLLFTNAARELALLKGEGEFDLTAVQGISMSPHSAFVPHLAALDKFCDFLTLCYTDPHWLGLMDELVAEGKRKYTGAGGVSDMTAFSVFNQSGKGRVLDLHLIRDESVFDLYLGEASGYEMKDGLMHVSWIDGLPHGRHLESGKSIRFKTLHFQGSQAKVHMGDYVCLSSAEEKAEHQLNLARSARGVFYAKWRRRLRRWTGRPAWDPGI